MGFRALGTVKFRLLVRCIGRIGLWLEFVSVFNVGVRARLRFRVVMQCEGL